MRLLSLATVPAVNESLSLELVTLVAGSTYDLPFKVYRFDNYYSFIQSQPPFVGWSHFFGPKMKRARSVRSIS